MEERLQKFMARCGVASRRKCEELIANGRVTVNETMVNALGAKIDPKKDRVKVDGKPIEPEEHKVYIALNKPVGVVSTVKDEHNRKTILDIVKVPERVYPIGRLDFDSSGLIILTNDGDVYNNVIHPRENINKVYLATLKGHPTTQEIDKFRSGVDIGGYITAPAEFRILKVYKSCCDVEIIIHEGKNRQIRRMCEIINHPVLALERIAVGKISLGSLKTGEWRHLSDEEISYLRGR